MMQTIPAVEEQVARSIEEQWDNNIIIVPSQKHMTTHVTGS